jgi:predicted hydrocarbon binding protein
LSAHDAASSLASSETELIQRDHDDVLRDTLTNSRVMILSCSAYRCMCETLFDTFKSGAGVILYEMGFGYSRKLAETISKLQLSIADALQTMEMLARAAGWGRLTVRMLDEDSRAECVVVKSAFVVRRNDIGPVSCHFLAGVLGGAASQLFDAKFKARETACASSGAQVCKFEIARES